MIGRSTVSYLLFMTLGAGLPATAHAQEVFKGIGSGFCHEFLEMRDLPEIESAFASWVYGFFTGSNLVFYSTANQTMRDLSGPELTPTALMERVSADCEADPKQQMLTVLAPIYADLPFHELQN